MKTMNVDKIDAIRTFSVDMFDENLIEQDSGQLVSPFEGRFYIKFADDQYKPFDQIIAEDSVAETTDEKTPKETAAKNDMYMVDYSGQQAEEEVDEQDVQRLEGAIVDLFNDMTNLNRNQLELDEITESDLYGDDD